MEFESQLRKRWSMFDLKKSTIFSYPESTDSLGSSTDSSKSTETIHICVKPYSHFTTSIHTLIKKQLP
jgi:hypothetical protein